MKEKSRSWMRGLTVGLLFMIALFSALHWGVFNFGASILECVLSFREQFKIAGHLGVCVGTESENSGLSASVSCFPFSKLQNHDNGIRTHLLLLIKFSSYKPFSSFKNYNFIWYFTPICFYIFERARMKCAQSSTPNVWLNII